MNYGNNTQNTLGKTTQQAFFKYWGELKKWDAYSGCCEEFYLSIDVVINAKGCHSESLSFYGVFLKTQIVKNL